MKSDFDEYAEIYKQREQERRRLFFEAMDIPDDERLNPVMTRDEFLEFCKGKKIENEKYDSMRGKKCIQVYFEFAPYHDVNYAYCFDDDTVYESRFYIGD